MTDERYSSMTRVSQPRPDKSLHEAAGAASDPQKGGAFLRVGEHNRYVATTGGIERGGPLAAKTDIGPNP